VLRLDGEPRRLALIEVGGRPDPLEQVETEIAPQRFLDHLAVAPPGTERRARDRQIWRVKRCGLTSRCSPGRQSVQVTACPICDRGEPLDVIAELESVWITAATTAPLPGYVCVVAKSHVEEPYELRGEQGLLFWEEAMRVAEAVARTIVPEKMNYEIHGNTIRHLHMHLFPRMSGDPFEDRPIDAGHLEFSRTAAELEALADAIRRFRRS
jgi:diadenosine tetraphosphate (Ap4A) HIT family hydrolase